MPETIAHSPRHAHGSHFEGPETAVELFSCRSGYGYRQYKTANYREAEKCIGRERGPCHSLHPDQYRWRVASRRRGSTNRSIPYKSLRSRTERQGVYRASHKLPRPILPTTLEVIGDARRKGWSSVIVAKAKVGVAVGRWVDDPLFLCGRRRAMCPSAPTP